MGQGLISWFGAVGADCRSWPLCCPLTVEITVKNLLLVEIKVWPNKCYRGLSVCPHFAVMSGMYVEVARQLRKHYGSPLGPCALPNRTSPLGPCALPNRATSHFQIVPLPNFTTSKLYYCQIVPLPNCATTEFAHTSHRCDFYPRPHPGGRGRPHPFARVSRACAVPHPVDCMSLHSDNRPTDRGTCS